MMPTAYVLINTNVGTETEFLKDLKKIDAVKNAHIVMGEYDVVATLECNTVQKLKECINLKLRYLDNVVSTMTLMAFAQA
jgi:DNA-binding Lrp family transcriptional regulator